MSMDAAWVAANFGEADAAPFSRADLSELSLHLEPKVLEWGEVLFNEGEYPPGVWILQCGAIELIYGTGSCRALVRIIRPGEAVGDIQILRGIKSAFKARAAEPSACLFIERSKFDSLLLTCPSIGRRWFAKLAMQVSLNHNRIVDLLTNGLRERVARFLLHESVDGAFRHSQLTIGSMLGVHRSSINQILGKFEELGLVRLSYRCIEIHDQAGLTRMAEGCYPAKSPSTTLLKYSSTAQSLGSDSVGGQLAQ